MQELLNKIAQQFLSGVPLKDLNIGNLIIEKFSLQDQEELINKTINSKLVLDYPIKTDYQKAFIRYFVDKLDKHNCEVHDQFYSIYGKLVALSESKGEYFKHYLVKNPETTISLKENVNLISEGTTGLRTWQASLALAEWSLKNHQLLSQKTILELGSGIGLTGLAVSLLCAPKKLFFSDCHPSVLNSLCENIDFNNKEDCCEDIPSVQCDNLFQLNKTLKSGVSVSVLNLPWEDVDETVCAQIGDVDFILAADVVYDIDLFDPLIQALNTIFVQCNVQGIIFACTERNPDTLKEFLGRVGHTFVVEEIECPDQENFIWCADPPVRLFKFIQ